MRGDLHLKPPPATFSLCDLKKQVAGFSEALPVCKEELNGSSARCQLQRSLPLGIQIVREGCVTFLAVLTEVTLCKCACLMSREARRCPNEGLHLPRS